jgi:hypothetical protein
MPRRSNKFLLENELSSRTRDELIRSLLLPDGPDLLNDTVYHNHLTDLLALAELLAGLRYLNPRSIGSAGRLPIADIITEFLNYPEEDGFLANFRVTPESFWALVELLDHWHQNSGGDRGGGPGRPAFQQIAVALYVLGSAGGTFERIRMKLNIGKGTIQTYLIRTMNLLASLSHEYVCWPAAELRHRLQQQAQRHDEVFANCVGYLDGSEIRLRDRPMKDPEAYFSRKKIYGFNLQGICDQEGRFTYAHAGYTASAHDSTAFKGTPFYERRK